MPEYIDVNRNVYDVLAEQYQTRAVIKSCYEEPPEVLGEFALRNISPPEHGQAIKVAEIGPGNGYILSYFEKKGCRTIGVELSANMSNLCRKNSPNSIIINSNILDVSFLNNQFDLIYMGAVIHLFPKSDAELLLNMVNNWLRDDGVLFVNTTCDSISSEGYLQKDDYVGSPMRFRKKWTEEEFVSCVLSYGFYVIEKIYTDEKDRNKLWVAITCKKVRTNK